MPPTSYIISYYITNLLRLGAAHMLWLDSNYPPDADPSKPGVGLACCCHIIIVSVMRTVS